MRIPIRQLVLAAVLLIAGAGGYGAFVSYSNGAVKTVTIEAGVSADGRMYFRCVADESTAGVCDEARPNEVTVNERDRIELTVRTDDGLPHSHDFRVEGFGYGFPFPWVELELKDPAETRAFTAWRAGDHRFVCELPGHEDAGMWGTLHVLRA